jgi:hypothetical protein
MAAAFLRGLADWAVAHIGDEHATTVLPIGRANASEVLKVLRALDRARIEEKENAV